MIDPSASVEWIAIAFGGALGAVARFALTRAVGVARRAQHVLTAPEPSALARDPAWATLTANLLACLALGWLTAGFSPALAASALETRTATRPIGLESLGLAFGATGLCGSLSTFSTLCADARRLASVGPPGSALLYLLVQAVGGPALLLLGATLAR